MKQFVVPQFIDVESKIIGPISVRQFIMLLATGIVIYINYELFSRVNFWYFAISSLFIFAFGGTLAFLRINGRPFHYFLLNLFNTFKEPRLRVWNKEFTKIDFKKKKERPVGSKVIPLKKPLSSSRLAKLSLIVDTGGAYKEEDFFNNNHDIDYIKRNEEEDNEQ